MKVKTFFNTKTNTKLVMILMLLVGYSSAYAQEEGDVIMFKNPVKATLLDSDNKSQKIKLEKEVEFKVTEISENKIHLQVCDHQEKYDGKIFEISKSIYDANSISVSGPMTVRDLANKNIKDAFKKQLGLYNCTESKLKAAKAVHDKILSENLYGIYKAIIPNLQGLANNASAITYSQKKKEKTLGVSYTHAFGQNKRNFFNAGLKVAGENFPILENQEWNKNVGLNLGFSRVCKSSQFFNSYKCNEVAIKRKKYAKRQQNYRQGILYLDTAIINQQKADYKKQIKKSIDKKSKEAYQTTVSLTKKIDSLDVLLSKYYSNISCHCAQKAENLVVDDLVAFDNKQDLLYGYNIRWWAVNAEVKRTDIILSDQVNTKTKYEDDFFDFSIIGGYRWSHQGKKTLKNLTIDIKISKGTFLDDPTFRKSPTVKINPAIKDNSFTKNTLVYVGKDTIGVLGNIHVPVWKPTISIYYANFCLFDKTLGFSFEASSNFGFFEKGAIKNYNYTENFSFLGGILFRNVNEADFAKSTFGVAVGWRNAPFRNNQKDYFGINFFVGVPFKAFIKNK